MWLDPVSHFVCPGKVRGKVEGMAESGIAYSSKLDLDRRSNFFQIGHGFLSGSTMQFFRKQNSKII